jgi:hypothetical protein|tara:strand:- start:366 stop:572 length:207 start_codon:yes stop_codon:yes gene_type:complete
MVRLEDFEDFRDSVRSSKVKIKKSKEPTDNEKIVQCYLNEEPISSIAKKLGVDSIHVSKVLDYCGLDH